MAKFMSLGIDRAVRVDAIRVISVLPIELKSEITQGPVKKFAVAVSLGPQASVCSDAFDSIDQALIYYKQLIHGEHNFSLEDSAVKDGQKQ